MQKNFKVFYPYTLPVCFSILYYVPIMLNMQNNPMSALATNRVLRFLDANAAVCPNGVIAELFVNVFLLA